MREQSLADTAVTYRDGAGWKTDEHGTVISNPESLAMHFQEPRLVSGGWIAYSTKG
jgi:hypothetical protein